MKGRGTKWTEHTLRYVKWTFQFVKSLMAPSGEESECLGANRGESLPSGLTYQRPSPKNGDAACLSKFRWPGAKLSASVAQEAEADGTGLHVEAFCWTL